MQTAVPSLSQVGLFSVLFFVKLWDRLGFQVSAKKKPFIWEDQNQLWHQTTSASAFYLLAKSSLGSSLADDPRNLSWLRENTSDLSRSSLVSPSELVVTVLHMPNQLLRWCSAPPSCPLPPRTLIVRAVEEEKWEVEVWAQGAAFRLYTAWFSRRTNWTQLCRTQPLGSPFAPRSKLTSWSAKCFLMWVWPPAGKEMMGAFGTGWEGDAVGQPRLHPAKLQKVPVMPVLKVCDTAEALGGAVVVMQLTSLWNWNPCCLAACVWWSLSESPVSSHLSYSLHWCRNTKRAFYCT